MTHRAPIPVPLPEHLAHHAEGTPRHGAGRVAGGVLLEGVVVATYLPGDRPNRTDIAESANRSVCCDVFIVDTRTRTVLRGVPVMTESQGLNDRELWIPRAATITLSGGSLDFTAADHAAATDPLTTDGDRVIVGFLGNDLNRPVILGALAHPKSLTAPSSAESPAYVWRRRVRGSVIGIRADGQIDLDASGASSGAYGADGAEPADGTARIHLVGPGGLSVDMDSAGVTVTLASGQVFQVAAGGAGPEKVILGETFIADLNDWMTGMTAMLTSMAAINTPALAAGIGAIATTMQTAHATFAGKVTASTTLGAPHLSALTKTE